jgi:hypothetical protein
MNSQSSSAPKSCAPATRGEKRLKESIYERRFSPLPPSADNHKIDVPRRKVGDIVYVKTPAGPIVRVTIVKVRTECFEGTISQQDDRRLWLAGVPESPPGFVSVFFDHQATTKEAYESDDPGKWTVRIKRPR